MFTIRNIGGAALFLAGTTWLWLTPAFASREVSTSGFTWAITRALCLLTVVGFCVATYGLFTRHAWWEPVALASAALGLVTLIPYWFAATHSGNTSGGSNLERIRSCAHDRRHLRVALGPTTGTLG